MPQKRALSYPIEIRRGIATPPLPNLAAFILPYGVWLSEWCEAGFTLLLRLS